jgi:hypothetical protein
MLRLTTGPSHVGASPTAPGLFLRLEHLMELELALDGIDPDSASNGNR